MLLDDLNEAQRAAVECIDKPSLVIAGAGSGKTRVLTYKIAYLLEQGMQPWNILALTFTNKAAREMQQRIGKQVNPDLARNLWMGTFHSIFSRILRVESQYIGFTSNFTIYDDSDQKSLIRTIIREMQLDDKQYTPGIICKRLSDAKNRLIFPDKYSKDSEALKHDKNKGIPRFNEIYLLYMQRCQRSDAMDFDDLLLYTFYLFEKYPEICLKYQERFHFVLVDEYQDTNYAQHRIVWQLTKERQRVCVVGDDAQSIYSFRGANINNILQFQSLYNNAQLFKLERNYRSTQIIVKAANSLISYNQGQIHKEVFSQEAEGQKIQQLNVANDIEEAIVVAACICNLHNTDHVPYSEIVVLYRTNSQSRIFEEEFQKKSLPYKIYGGISFYQRKEIKDVLAYLRLVLNPHDEEALRRIINYPKRDIGNTTLDKITKTASSANVSLWNIICNPDAYQLDVSKSKISKILQFAQMILSFHELIETTDVYTLTDKILKETGIIANINSGTSDEDITKQENIQELLNSIANFVKKQSDNDESVLLNAYLQQVSLLSDIDEVSQEQQNDFSQNDKINLMTIHNAKGLEYRVVFVVGLVTDVFPSYRVSNDNRELEEERRLMYVAITRAKERLYLTCPKTIYRYGNKMEVSPSRFLREIDKRFISTGPSSFSSSNASSSFSSSNTFRTSRGTNNNPFGSSGLFDRVRTSPHSTPQKVPTTGNFVKISGRAYDAGIKPMASQSTSSSSSVPSLKAGNVVEHSRFGRGVVEAVEGNGIDAKATVKFENVGTKQLLLRFAKITVIS